MSIPLYKIEPLCYPAKMVSQMPTCAELLTYHFIEYQKNAGETKKLKEFAVYLGIHEVTLNRLINGKRLAGTSMLFKLAKALNDPRFYEVANAPKPASKTEKDPLQGYVDRNWDSAPEDIKQQIANLVAPYTSEPMPSKNVSKNHATN